MSPRISTDSRRPPSSAATERGGTLAEAKELQSPGPDPRQFTLRGGRFLLSREGNSTSGIGRNRPCLRAIWGIRHHPAGALPAALEAVGHNPSQAGLPANLAALRPLPIPLPAHCGKRPQTTPIRRGVAVANSWGPAKKSASATPRHHGAQRVSSNPPRSEEGEDSQTQQYARGPTWACGRRHPSGRAEMMLPCPRTPLRTNYATA